MDCPVELTSLVVPDFIFGLLEHATMELANRNRATA
jgi:hypothetical protein